MTLTERTLTLQSLESAHLEVLEMNSYGMHLCQNKNLEEAQECLETAYMRLQALAAALNAAAAQGGVPSAEDEDPEPVTAEQVQMVDNLKAATLTNLGVVESHRGEHQRALDHLEAAQLIELRNNIQSPATCLNLCAVYNAMHDYEQASRLALEAISILNAAGETLTEDSKPLWGAAWHNLGVAECNCPQREPSRRTADVLAIFRNAMAATKDLLGVKHPMTIAVFETYRALRGRLREEGAFATRVPSMLPRLRTAQRASTAEVPLLAHSLRTHTFTHGNGPVKPTPEPSRFLAMPPYTGAKKRTTVPAASLAHFHPTVKNLGSLRLYRSRHPLIQQLQGPLPPIHSAMIHTIENGVPATARSSSKQKAIKAPGVVPTTTRVPQPPPSPHPATHEAPNTSRVPPKRRLSELLLGDMWVEVQVPRYTSPSATRSSTQHSPVRPGYGEALYVIDPADAAVEPISEPSAHAQLDIAQQRTSDPPPNNDAVHVQRPLCAADEIARALGDNIHMYPSLQALVEADAAVRDGTRVLPPENTEGGS